MSKTPTCKCGRGKMSAYDGKCGHCRSRKEQKAHTQRLVYGDKYAGHPPAY